MNPTYTFTVTVEMNKPLTKEQLVEMEDNIAEACADGSVTPVDSDALLLGTVVEYIEE